MKRHLPSCHLSSAGESHRTVARVWAEVGFGGAKDWIKVIGCSEEDAPYCALQSVFCSFQEVSGGYCMEWACLLGTHACRTGATRGPCISHSSPSAAGKWGPWDTSVPVLISHLFHVCLASLCVSPHRVWLEPQLLPHTPCVPPLSPISLLCLFGCLSLWCSPPILLPLPPCSPSPVKPELPFLSLSTTLGPTSPLLLALSDSLHQALSEPSQQTPQHHQPPSVAQ